MQYFKKSQETRRSNTDLNERKALDETTNNNTTFVDEASKNLVKPDDDQKGMFVESSHISFNNDNSANELKP